MSLNKTPSSRQKTSFSASQHPIAQLQRPAPATFPVRRQPGAGKLSDLDDLWRLLEVIAARKALNHQRSHQRRAKRGSGKVYDQAALAGVDGDDNGLAEVAGAEPTPEFAAQVVEQLERIMDGLP